jgi:hypothetical protein
MLIVIATEYETRLTHVVTDGLVIVMEYRKHARGCIQEHRYPVVFEYLSVRNDYPHTVAVLSYFGSVG